MTASIDRPLPRARFAPSPTGFFHVGSARAALFNWLFVRQHDGTFILRIEDTDAARNRPEWTDGIITALDWLGMAPDEGPYFQSAQADVHAAAIEALWDSGALYACECTREQIDERTRQRAAAGDPTPGYDGYCRDLGLARGEGRALRFRTPDDGVVEVHDLVRGDVEFPQRALEDFICVKGNGQPLFVLANAVDDRTMAISHVIRGEDQLPTTPRQIMLWGALNRAEGVDLALPAYAHLPLLVNEQGKKLSKRRDPVAVEMYREQGYLPAAFRNYLALLGWSPGDEEIVPLGVILERFRLEDVQRSPAFFDVKKLSHMNGVYIRELSVEEFVAATRPWVDPVAGEWAPGGWIDPDTGSAGGDAAPLGAGALRPRRLRRGGGGDPGAGDRAERGARAGRLLVPGGRAGRSRQLAEGDRRRRRRRADSGRRAGAPTRRCRRGTRTRCTRSRWPSPRRWAANWARRRRPSGWRSWAAPGDCPCSTRWRCWAAARRAAAWRPRSDRVTPAP